MSELPEVDLHRVNNKLALKNAELQHQVFQLETLAEQLRDQRDSAAKEVESLRPAPKPE